MNVAVLGAGVRAWPMAAALALAGHTVRWWAPDENALGPLRAAGGVIRVGDGGQRKAALARATADLAEAVAGAEVVIASVAATAQRDLAARLAAVPGEGQIVLLTPGIFGSYVVARDIARSGGRLPVAFAETGTLPCLAPVTGPAGISAPVRAADVPIGVFPAARSEAALDRLRALFPAIRPCQDVLDAALASAGPVVHPPLVLLNGAAIDAGKSAIDVSATTPGVRRLVDSLDGERQTIRARLGFSAPHVEIQPALPAGGPPEDVTFAHPYVADDAALGLSLFESAGRLAGADTPAISGILSVFSALLGRDLRSAGRGLDRLGLGDFVRREIGELLHEGWRSTLWRRALSD